MSVIGISTTEIIHRATQYLTAAAISSLEPQKDDSHTNLGWNADKKAFITRNLNGNELFLALNINNYRLEFLRQDKVLASKPLKGSSHFDILKWLSEVFKDLSIKVPYKFAFHYELPYEKITHDYTFEYVDEAELQNEINLRDQAYKVLKNVVQNYDKNVEVRTWPHHFDTGALINVGENLSIGLGLAIPDSMVNEYYYYVSGWKGSEMMSVANLPDLKKGEWKNDSWKGAILEANNSSNIMVNEFLSEVIEYLK